MLTSIGGLLLLLGLCHGQVQTMNHPRNVGRSSPLDSVKSDWGYVNVRENAHMFWWLFFQDPTYQPTFLSKIDPIPVVVWLQGGPGASGVGYGNFEECGPLDVNLNRRNTSWTGLAHVLFVDNPVGSGYSYVTDSSAFTKNIDEIADDMVALMKGFYAKHPELTSNPLYIFCESYGGKMAAATALALSKEIEAGSMNIDLKGVGLGDAWISPMDSVNTWAEYLYQTGLLDDVGRAAVNKAAQATQNAVDQGNWEQATNLWSLTELSIMKNSDNVDFYNILAPHYPDGRALRQKLSALSHLVPEDRAAGYAIHVDTYAEDPLDQLMNGDVKEYLNIPTTVTWGGQSNDVFNAQAGDFMKPVIATVITGNVALEAAHKLECLSSYDHFDALVNTGIKVLVYNGHLDLIVDTPGQEMWLKKMSWSRLSEFMDMNWTPRYAYNGEDTGGFSKKLGNFEFWWVLKAGHMVPADVGEFMLYMLHDHVVES